MEEKRNCRKRKKRERSKTKIYEDRKRCRMVESLKGRSREGKRKKSIQPSTHESDPYLLPR